MDKEKVDFLEGYLERYGIIKTYRVYEYNEESGRDSIKVWFKEYLGIPNMNNHDTDSIIIHFIDDSDFSKKCYPDNFNKFFVLYPNYISGKELNNDYFRQKKLERILDEKSI